MTDAAWSWDDYRADHGDPPDAALVDRAPLAHGGAHRPHNRLARFTGTAHHASRDDAALRAGHRAIVHGHTLFRKSVVPADETPRLLVSGENSAKLGREVTRGPWAGMPIYQLTLEERATCPRSCTLWQECMGNAMPFARRHRAGPELEERLRYEIGALARRHPDGFVVRIHVLGDFYSIEYARTWFRLVHAHPELHVFGYTAHAADSEIGELIGIANHEFAGRWMMRFSVPPDAPPAPDQATTIWRQARGRVPEGVVCPAQTGDTLTCGTCGLCWLQQASDVRVVFIGHGMNHRPSAIKTRSNEEAV